MPFESCRTSTLTVSVHSGFLDMLLSLSIFRSQVGPVTQGLLHSPLPALRRDQTTPLNGARTRTDRYEPLSTDEFTRKNIAVASGQHYFRPLRAAAPAPSLADEPLGRCRSASFVFCPLLLSPDPFGRNCPGGPLLNPPGGVLLTSFREAGLRQLNRSHMARRTEVRFPRGDLGRSGPRSRPGCR
jgi:hypothetical protein